MAHWTGLDLLVPHLHGHTMSDVVGELTDRLIQSGCALERTAFLDTALQRELEYGTWVEPGWALPHARVRRISATRFALGKATRPVLWGGNRQPTQWVFLFAVPAEDGKPYLSLLSGIARLGQSPALLREMQKATGAEAMFDVLRKVQLP
jgi:mannitol/fructose-specific phosphotransferase system IIA component (Ntr-type)